MQDRGSVLAGPKTSHRKVKEMYKLVVENTEGKQIESPIVMSLEKAVRLEMHINKSPQVRAVHIVPEDVDVDEKDIDTFINDLVW